MNTKILSTLLQKHSCYKHTGSTEYFIYKSSIQ